MADEVPTSIRIAFGQLSGIPGVEVESAPEFIPNESSWAIRLRLLSNNSSEYVPERTCWIVVVDNSYPAGRIRIYPAQSGGLSHTFPHQDRNIDTGSSNTKWRTGKPCLDSSTQRLGRIAGGPEPKGDAEQRLRWHVERCLAWIDVAAIDQLMVSGEPFEVPQCPHELLMPHFTVVHDEGMDTSIAWRERIGNYGEIRWSDMPGFKSTIVAEKFFDVNDNQIRCCRRPFHQTDESTLGYWWLWPSPIVIPPWHAPGTWAEIRRIAARLMVNTDDFIQWMAYRVRGKERVIILLGYPIPALWKGDPVEIHWQAILSPHIPSKIQPMKGFRDNPLGKSEWLCRQLFGGDRKLNYLKTENWHPDRLQARGRISSEIRTKSIAIIGAGALGSAVAEILVRGGVSDILIIDHDDLEVGNLVRHTLTGTDIGHNKATAIAARLQGVAPMSRINSRDTSLPQGSELQMLLDPYEVVLDCTGDDEVLRLLSESWWSIPRYFLSASVGFAANRIFLFRSHACSFPVEEFEIAVRPWLLNERKEWATAGEILEGAGCWSPLFPARCDDVWLAAITTVRNLERFISGEDLNGLSILEQRLCETSYGQRPNLWEGGEPLSQWLLILRLYNVQLKYRLFPLFRIVCIHNRSGTKLLL